MTSTVTEQARRRTPLRAPLLALLLTLCGVIALSSATAASAAPAAIPLTSSQCPTDMQQGEVDGCVTTLQQRLNADAGAGLSVDGNWGAATTSAVRSFQSARCLGVDGIVGPGTKAALNANSSSCGSGGSHTNLEFANLVLADGGWPQGGNNATVILQWMASEEPVSNWYNRDNPLNNSAGTSSTNGTSSYPNLRTAASYVVKTLSLSYYNAIRADLAASAAPSTTATAIQNSPWAESHYGHGSTWHYGAVATTTCPASAW